MVQRPRYTAWRPAWLACLLLLGVPLAAPVPGFPDSLPIAAAQGAPQYADASNGLPDYSLWVSKTHFFDIDEDGTGDVMVLGPRKGPGDRSLHVFKWDGDSWSNESSVEGTTAISHSSYGGYGFGDLNNDGDWDVGVGSHGADGVDAYLKIFGSNWVRSSQGLQASEDAWNVDVGDFNSDGNLDLLVAGVWERDIRVYSGDGNGNWVDSSNGLGTASSSSEARFCDVNNDGHLDVVHTIGEDLEVDETWWVHRGDGNGNWYNYSSGLPLSGHGSATTCGDFNNDGNVDIALSFWGSTVGAYFGDGAGNWVESSIGLTDLSYSALELVDLNNDGYDDLVALQNSDPGRIHVYLRDSNTQTWNHLSTNMQGNAKGFRLDVGDFDHNGHADIVAGFGSDNSLEFPGSVRVWRETSVPTELDIALIQPDGGERLNSDAVRFVRWRSAVPAATGPRSVTLELSTTGAGGPWTTVADNLPDTGIYQWTVPDVESGDCYLRVTVGDGVNSASDVSDSAFGIGAASAVNHPPEMEVTRPAQDEEADAEYRLEWQADDDDGDEVTIDLYYDNDTNPDNGRELIIAGLANDGFHDWNTSGIEAGDYHIYGVADDNNGSRTTDHAAGRVLVRHPSPNIPPAFNLTAPADTGESADANYTITWNASDDDGDELSITLWYDDDTDPDNGHEPIANGLADSGSYDWNTSAVAEGDYRLCGEADDGSNTTRDCADFRLTIAHPEEANEPPTLLLLTPIDDQQFDEGVTVRWAAADADGDDLNVSLAYLASGTAAPVTLAMDLPALGSWYWDTSPLSDGNYHLIGSVDDGRDMGWYNITILIHHAPTAEVRLTGWQLLPVSPHSGDTVTLIVNVTNDGAAAAQVTLTYVPLAGPPLVLNPRQLDIPAGATVRPAVQWVVEAGDYRLAVNATRAGDADDPVDNTLLVTVQVAAAPAGDDDEDIAAWVWVLGGMALLGGAGGAAMAVRRVARRPPRDPGGSLDFEWE